MNGRWQGVKLNSLAPCAALGLPRAERGGVFPWIYGKGISYDLLVSYREGSHIKFPGAWEPDVYNRVLDGLPGHLIIIWATKPRHTATSLSPDAFTK